MRTLGGGEVLSALDLASVVFLSGHFKLQHFLLIATHIVNSSQKRFGIHSMQTYIINSRDFAFLVGFRSPLVIVVFIAYWFKLNANFRNSYLLCSTYVFMTGTKWHLTYEEYLASGPLAQANCKWENSMVWVSNPQIVQCAWICCEYEEATLSRPLYNKKGRKVSVSHEGRKQYHSYSYHFLILVRLGDKRKIYLCDLQFIDAR